MLFTYISEDCKCLSDSSEDNVSTFIRRVRKSPGLKDPDFRTHIERGKIPSENISCDELCGLNALSFEIWNEKSKTELLKKYNATAEFSPQSSKNLCVIKFKKDSGLLKYTPHQKSGINAFHYDFYKCDEFSVDKLELIDMIRI